MRQTQAAWKQARAEERRRLTDAVAKAEAGLYDFCQQQLVTQPAFGHAESAEACTCLE